ncbi:hypothetical protein HYH03_007060 [Edaphochlamys debaryana]|uniref:Uncharacterized protein n=1 Tax=Edaphochlamys debaryana TaxID=47281 RepID=A0A836C0S4_9CHLO|nr:hypothetical protein HYH03_007060 [Edaphochlamys debaryana]|eukprot:KAG2494818.1 hypothetical protein HYH03_007060 [Edaphochlamys debaryana]
MSAVAAVLLRRQEQRRRRLVVGALLAEHAAEEPQRPANGPPAPAVNGGPDNSADQAAAAGHHDGPCAGSSTGSQPLAASAQAALAALRRTHPTAVLCTRPRRHLLSLVGSAPASGGRRAWRKLLPWLLPAAAPQDPAGGSAEGGLTAASVERHGPAAGTDGEDESSDEGVGDMVAAELGDTVATIARLWAHDPALEPGPDAASLQPTPTPGAPRADVLQWCCDCLVTPAATEQRTVKSVRGLLCDFFAVMSSETQPRPAVRVAATNMVEDLMRSLESNLAMQRRIREEVEDDDRLRKEAINTFARDRNLECSVGRWRELDVPSNTLATWLQQAGYVEALGPHGFDRWKRLLTAVGSVQGAEKVARAALWGWVMLVCEGMLVPTRPLVCAAAAVGVRALQATVDAPVSATFLYYCLCAGTMPDSPVEADAAAETTPGAGPLSLEHVHCVIRRFNDHPGIARAWADLLFCNRAGGQLGPMGESKERVIHAEFADLVRQFNGDLVDELEGEAGASARGMGADDGGGGRGRGGGAGTGGGAAEAVGGAQAAERRAAEADSGEAVDLGPNESQRVSELQSALRELGAQPELPAPAGTAAPGPAPGLGLGLGLGPGQTSVPPPIAYAPPTPEVATVLAVVLIARMRDRKGFTLQPCVPGSAAAGDRAQAGAGGAAGAHAGPELHLWRGREGLPDVHGATSHFSGMQLKILLIAANSSMATEAKEVSAVMLKRRQYFCWVQGEGVVGVWKALQVLAKVRAEMLAVGRDLATCPVATKCCGDGTGADEVFAHQERERHAEELKKDPAKAKAGKAPAADAPPLVPRPAGVSMTDLVQRLDLLLERLAAMPAPLLGQAAPAAPMWGAVQKELRWCAQVETDLCRLLQRLLCKGEGGGPSYRDRVRVEFAVFECGLGRPHEPVLPPMPSASEKRRQEELRKALGLGKGKAGSGAEAKGRAAEALTEAGPGHGGSGSGTCAGGPRLSPSQQAAMLALCHWHPTAALAARAKARRRQPLLIPSTGGIMVVNSSAAGTLARPLAKPLPWPRPPPSISPFAPSPTPHASEPPRHSPDFGSPSAPPLFPTASAVPQQRPPTAIATGEGLRALAQLEAALLTLHGDVGPLVWPNFFADDSRDDEPPSSSSCTASRKDGEEGGSCGECGEEHGSVTLQHPWKNLLYGVVHEPHLEAAVETVKGAALLGLMLLAPGICREAVWFYEPVTCALVYGLMQACQDLNPGAATFPGLIAEVLDDAWLAPARRSRSFSTAEPGYGAAGRADDLEENGMGLRALVQLTAYCPSVPLAWARLREAYMSMASGCTDSDEDEEAPQGPATAEEAVSSAAKGVISAYAASFVLDGAAIWPGSSGAPGTAVGLPSGAVHSDTPAGIAVATAPKPATAPEPARDTPSAIWATAVASAAEAAAAASHNGEPVQLPPDQAVAVRDLLTSLQQACWLAPADVSASEAGSSKAAPATTAVGGGPRSRPDGKLLLGAVWQPRVPATTAGAGGRAVPAAAAGPQAQAAHSTGLTLELVRCPLVFTPMQAAWKERYAPIWDRGSGERAAFRPSSSVAAEVRRLRDALRREYLTYTDGEGVSGVWKMLQGLAKLRGEMLAAGQDLAAVVLGLDQYGDGSGDAEARQRWAGMVEQDICRLQQRLTPGAEGEGPSYRERVRVQVAVYECAVGRPHEPVLAPIPEKRRLEELRKAALG